MTLERFRELLGEQITAGFKDISQIPLVSRGPIVKAANQAFEEALEAAKGKSVDSPEMRTLEVVSRLIIGDWVGQKEKNTGLWVRDYTDEDLPDFESGPQNQEISSSTIEFTLFKRSYGDGDLLEE